MNKKIKFQNIKLLIFALFIGIFLSSGIKNTFATTQAEMQIFIKNYNLLKENGTARRGGIRLEFWKVDKEEDLEKQLKILNTRKDPEMSAIFGEPVISDFFVDRGDDVGIIKQNLDLGTRYYIRELNIEKPKYMLSPILIDFDAEMTIYIKEYVDSPIEEPPNPNNEDPTPPTPPTPPNNPQKPPTDENPNNPSGETPRGSFRFMKVAANRNKTPLLGAMFKVTTKVDNNFESVLRDGEPYILTSDADGMFEAKDLPYGTYYLWEIKAPAGYKLLSAPVEFSISQTSENEKIVVISNVPITKIDVPKTGDITLLIIIISGILLYILGILIIKERR